MDASQDFISLRLIDALESMVDSEPQSYGLMEDLETQEAMPLDSEDEL
jgi:hypothetical protein